MSNIKVLHVIARMNVGGTSRYVGELISKIEHSELATGGVQGAEIEDDVVRQIKVHRMRHLGRKISPINDFRSWLELREIIKSLQPAIIHTHTFKAGLIGRLSWGTGKKIHTFHGHLFDDDSFKSYEKMAITYAERFLARRADLLISVGARVGTELREKGIGKGQRWIAIPPGISALPAHDKAESRVKLDLPEGQLLIGWMARMVAVKNPILLLKIAELMPDIHFVMAGGGEMLTEIRKSKPENVTVLGWTEASLFWSAVDLAVSTSNNEGMPIALIEAQMAGIPVVATDVGSSAEVISHGETGFVTKNGLTELVNLLQLLVNDQVLLKKMGEKASRRALEAFSAEKMIDAHRAAYKSVT